MHQCLCGSEQVQRGPLLHATLTLRLLHFEAKLSEHVHASLTIYDFRSLTLHCVSQLSSMS